MINAKKKTVPSIEREVADLIPNETAKKAKYPTRKLIGMCIRLNFHRTNPEIIVNKINIPPPATAHQDTGNPKIIEDTKIPKAAGLNTCRFLYFIYCLEANPNITANIIAIIPLEGCIISPIKSPETNEENGIYNFLDLK